MLIVLCGIWVDLLYLQPLYSQCGDGGCFSVTRMLHVMTVVYYPVGHILYILRTNTSEIVTWWKEVTCHCCCFHYSLVEKLITFSSW